MKKVAKGIGNILLIVVIFAALMIIFPRVGCDREKEKEWVQGVDYFLNDNGYAEEEEQLKMQASEIEGMTRYDKLQAGFNPYGDDTDNDGLSDAEELNVYEADASFYQNSHDCKQSC